MGSDARLVWVAPEVIEAAGIEGWTELPVWAPPDGEAAGLHTGDVSKVYAAGLTCRPVAETVADTWAWLQAEGDPPAPRPGRPRHGLDPDREREVLAGLAASMSEPGSADGRGHGRRARSRPTWAGSMPPGRRRSTRRHWAACITRTS